MRGGSGGGGRKVMSDLEGFYKNKNDHDPFERELLCCSLNDHIWEHIKDTFKSDGLSEDMFVDLNVW